MPDAGDVSESTQHLLPSFPSPRLRCHNFARQQWLSPSQSTKNFYLFQSESTTPILPLKYFFATASFLVHYAPFLIPMQPRRVHVFGKSPSITAIGKGGGQACWVSLLVNVISNIVVVGKVIIFTRVCIKPRDKTAVQYFKLLWINYWYALLFA